MHSEKRWNVNMSKIPPNKFKGKWKITEMEQWDVEPGWFIEFDGKGNG